MQQGREYGPQWSASLRRTTGGELETWLEFALACADEAEPIALQALRGAVETRAKADGSFVTQADLAIEELIRDRISRRFPSHRVTGEEYGRDAAAEAVRWYVDPIDGTHNFMRGIPLFATLIAVECGGELQASVVNAPALRQRWYAARGLGAWTVDRATGAVPRRITVSGIDTLADAQVLYRSVRDMEASRFPRGFDDLRHSVWRERGFGDFWGYALVADASAEAMIEQGLGPWDLAAPWVVVEEAGGRITDFDGTRSLDRGEGLATNGILHSTLLSRLRRGDDPEGSRE